MAEEQSLNDDLESFADALRSLTPRPVQRDRLMFEIWQGTTDRHLSAARVRLRSWQLATGVSTSLAMTFAGLWFANLISHSRNDAGNVQAATPISDRVEVQAVSPHPQRSDFGIETKWPNGDLATSYIHQRNRALAEGIESIPVPRVSGGVGTTIPRTSREILESIRYSQELGG